MAKITKDMIIRDSINVDNGLVQVLMASGMHCVGCPASSGESLAQACMVHGLDADTVEARLNEYLEAKNQ